VSTRRVVIEGEERLEGVLREGAGKAAAALCHPHPLYGGSMWNNVVDALDEGFFQAGFSTLRFNFRGVGASEGRFDGGAGEMRDLGAACRFLLERAYGAERLVLAGYSFGAWVCSRAASDIGRDLDLCLVAYPFSVYPAEELRAFRGKVCFIAGSFDEIAPVSALLALYRELPAEKFLKIIPCDHMFDGREQEITAFIGEIFGTKEV
jgi:alpha/beta superfamily hydrolase